MVVQVVLVVQRNDIVRKSRHHMTFESGAEVVQVVPSEASEQHDAADGQPLSSHIMDGQAKAGDCWGIPCQPHLCVETFTYGHESALICPESRHTAS